MEYRAVTVEPNSYELLRGVPPSARDGSATSPVLRLLKAFCLMMVMVVAMMSLMSGLFLLAESDDDLRGEGVGRYNKAVEAWNGQNRAAFAEAAPFRLGPAELSADLSATAEPLIKIYDSDPKDILQPDPLHYASSMSFGNTLPSEEWSPTDVEFPMVEIEFTASGHDVQKVVLPRRFTEQVCEWVQRGKWNRQVCKWHYYVLSSVCIKMGQSSTSDSWQPSFNLDGLKGQTSGVGCYMYGSPTADMHNYRGLYLWSAGNYEEAQYRLETPETIPVEVRSDADPELLVDELTAGMYDFGPTQAAKFLWGTIMTICGSAVMCTFCFCVFLQYSWPQATSNTERTKYFYRRHLRTKHIWIKKTWANLTGGNAAAVVEEAAADEEPSNWAGPTDGGYKLGQAPPALHDPNQT